MAEKLRSQGDQWALSGCGTFRRLDLSRPLQSTSYTQGNEARALLAFYGSSGMLPSSLGSDEFLLGSLQLCSPMWYPHPTASSVTVGQGSRVLALEPPQCLRPSWLTQLAAGNHQNSR